MKTKLVEFPSPDIIWKKKILNDYNLPQTFPPSYAGNIGDDSMFPNPDTQGVVKNDSVEILAMRDMFASPLGSLADDSHLYALSLECYAYEGDPPYNLYPASFSPIIENAVTAGHKYISNYAHFTFDFLSVILTIPEDILSKSKIIISDPTNIPFLKALGINGSNFVLPYYYSKPLLLSTFKKHMYDPNFIFSRHLYTITPWGCDSFTPALLDNVRRIITKKMNLVSKPFRYVLYNRKQNKRGIVNFDDIFKKAVSTWPEIPWEMGRETNGYFEGISYFYEIKLFFGVHGAALANCIFMQPGTVVCELMIQRWTGNFIYGSIYTGKHYVVGRDEKIPHGKDKVNFVDPLLILNMLRIGLSHLNNV